MGCMTGPWEGAFFTRPGIILVSDRPHLSPKRTKDIPCLTNSGGAPLTHYVSESPTQGGPYVSLLPNFFIKCIVMAFTFNRLWSSKICAPVAAWHLMWMWGIKKPIWSSLTFLGDQGSSQAQMTEACKWHKGLREKIYWVFVEKSIVI